MHAARAGSVVVVQTAAHAGIIRELIGQIDWWLVAGIVGLALWDTLKMAISVSTILMLVALGTVVALVVFVVSGRVPRFVWKWL